MEWLGFNPARLKSRIRWNRWGLSPSDPMACNRAGSRRLLLQPHELAVGEFRPRLTIPISVLCFCTRETPFSASS
jgi:hypothetical protein